MDDLTGKMLMDKVQRLSDYRLRRNVGSVKSISNGTVTVTAGSVDHTFTRSLDSFVPVAGDRVWLSRSGGELVPHAALTDTSNKALSFATGWSNFGAPYGNGGYYRANGRVWLKGAVHYSSGGTNSIAVLPAGFRPPATLSVPVAIFGGTGLLSIDAGGTITDSTFSVGSKAALFLDNISWRLTNS